MTQHPAQPGALREDCPVHEPDHERTPNIPVAAPTKPAALARARRSVRRAAPLKAASSDHFRLIAENSPDLIAILDLGGRFRYANPAFGRLLDHDPAALIGTSVFHQM